MKTKAPERLPSDAGVTFKGFEDIDIESRERAKKELEDFLNYCNEATSPALRVIVGEWGEGKTDAYNRYVAPKAEETNNKSFFIASSTLANSYDQPEIKKLIEKTPLSSIRFLASVFYSIREEQGAYEIPQPKECETAQQLVERTFEKVASDDTRIFIFIDEFEELLLNPKLNEIISGIKETINPPQKPSGETSKTAEKLLHERGKYAGTLHFIISCTPDAFYRLETAEETSLIFGGLGRRAGTIELERIHKSEGIKFLSSLIDYAYKDSPPDPYPVKNFGILQALFRISQGNPGIMVSLFTRMFNDAKSQEGNLRVINYEEFLNFMGRQEISVYGGKTNCIEQEIYYRMLKTLKNQKRESLGQNTSELFKLFLGEFRPFSLEKLMRRFDIDDNEVYRAISQINQDLKRTENIDRSILHISSLEDDKKFQDVLDAFEEYIEKDRDTKILRIENYTESIDEFRDKITHYVLKNGKISEEIFLPIDKNSTRSFFEGISDDKAVELKNMMRKRLLEGEDYYIASDELLFQIYPTPVPQGLEFIKDRELRLKLWRETTRKLSEYFNRRMPEDFLSLIKSSNNLNLETERRNENWAISEVEPRNLGAINTLFYSINGDVKARDVEDISSLIKSQKPPIHLVILLYTGETKEDAHEKISYKEIGDEGHNYFIYVRVHPTLAKRIICANRSYLTHKSRIDEDLYNKTLGLWLERDIELFSRLESWIETQEEKGYVITDVQTSTNLKEFSDSLKFYINYYQNKGSSKEIFKRNRNNLIKFVFFNSRLGLIPDIESHSKLQNISEELEENGFLEKSDGKYKVRQHPVEKRILEILEKEAKATADEVRDYFIDKASRRKTLEDVYFSILQYKGQIKKEDGYYKLEKPTDYKGRVERKYREYKKAFDEAKSKGYDHVYVTKQRGSRIILVNEFDEQVTSLHDQIEELSPEKDRELFLQKLSLLERLLEHFKEEILERIRGASKRADSLKEDLQPQVTKVKNRLKEICKNCNKWFAIKIKPENINEYSEILKLKNEIRKKRDKSYNRGTLEEIAENLDSKERKAFFYNQSEDAAHYHNLKLMQIEKSSEDLREKIESLKKRHISDIEKTFEELENAQTELSNKITVWDIEKDFIVSRSILEHLKRKQISIAREGEKRELKESTLSDIKGYTEDIGGEILERLDSLDNCVDELEEILNNEKALKSEIKECEQFYSSVSQIFNVEEYEEASQELKIALDDVKDQYQEKADMNLSDSAETFEKQIGDLKKDLDSLREPLLDSKEEIEERWSEYRKQTKEFINRINEFLELIKKKGEVEEKNIKKQESELKSEVDYESVIELDISLSTLESKKQKIRNELYEAVSEFLDREEARILEIVIEKTKGKSDQWVSIPDFQEEVEQEMDMESDIIKAKLQKLVEEDYLEGGVSLYL